MPLAVRRQLEDVVAAVIHRDRIDPGGSVLLEIGFPQVAAVRLHEGVDLVRDLAFVENVAALFADQSQAMRQRRVLENVAFAGRTAFAIERVGFEKAAGKSFVKRDAARPIPGDQLRDREAFLRIFRRRERSSPNESFPNFLCSSAPAIDRSGPDWRCWCYRGNESRNLSNDDPAGAGVGSPRSGEDWVTGAAQSGADEPLVQSCDILRLRRTESTPNRGPAYRKCRFRGE